MSSEAPLSNPLPTTTRIARPHGRARRLIAALALRPQNAMLLPAIGAAVGLLIAALGVLHPPARSMTSVPAGYVALVNQKGILTSDFMNQIAVETGMPFEQTSEAQRHKILREMVNEELLVQRALVLDLPETTTEVRETMVDAVNVQAEAPELAREPTDEELRAFYQAHRSAYTSPGSMTVHDLVLHVGGYQNADQSASQALTDAAEAVYQLRLGASLDYVMGHFYLVDSGRVDNGEQLEFAAKLHLGSTLYALATTLSDGQISDPIVESDGVHVLIMDQRKPSQLADFSQVRDRVYTLYREAQRQHAHEANLSILRRDAQILLAPGRSE
jgi:hypothetical protein